MKSLIYKLTYFDIKTC